jgi:hypothetical protein
MRWDEVAPTRRSVLTITAVLVGLGAAALVLWAVTRGGDGDKVENATIDWVNGGPDSRQLRVTFAAGPGNGCAEANGVAVSETDKTVTLTATTITRDIPPSGKPCPSVAVLASRTVTLTSPLADRTVVDGPRKANGESGVVEVRAP